MRRRGYLLRFIDLGLIILFGFLMISDITVISQLSLPGKSDADAEPPAEEQVFLGVSILTDGQFEILNLEDRSALHVNISSMEELEFILRMLRDQHRDAGMELNLLIEPTPESSMQKLVDVLDVCQRVGVQKNINTEAVFEKRGETGEERGGV